MIQNLIRVEVTTQLQTSILKVFILAKRGQLAQLVAVVASLAWMSPVKFALVHVYYMILRVKLVTFRVWNGPAEHVALQHLVKHKIVVVNK